MKSGLAMRSGGRNSITPGGDASVLSADRNFSAEAKGRIDHKWDKNPFLKQQKNKNHISKNKQMYSSPAKRP